jgi:acylphosphatase
MSDRKVVHLVVRGRVQGVGFRAFVEEEAAARALSGWVRNRRDGSVEAVAAGSVAAVDELIGAVRSGPPASRVDAVDVATADESALAGHTGFALLPTV